MCETNLAKLYREYRLIIENRIIDTVPEFTDLDGNSFKTPPHCALKSVLEVLPSFYKNEHENNLRITTIHSVKGETLDAILLVSAPSKQGTQDGHWTQWLAHSNTEAARLAYVASSRPKHLLAWAIPTPVSKQEEDRICKLGFCVFDLKIDSSQ